MGRQGLREDCSHRQHDERRDQHQLVGNRIEDRAELRFLVETTRQQAVQAVSHSGENKNRQGEYESLIEKQRDKNRNQHHPEDGQQIGDGNYSGGH